MQVSCCIINYNNSAEISTQLDSILLQVRSPDEVIVYDDGSTDNSLEVAESYFPYLDEATNSNYIVAGTKVNNGICFAANQVAKMAQHDLFYGGCSNDLLLPQFFEKSVLSHERNSDCAFSFSDPSHFADNWVDPKSMGLGDKPIRFTPEESKKLLKKSLFLSGFTCVYKKDLWNEYGGLQEEFAHHSDWLLNMILAARYPIVYAGPQLARTRYTGKGFADKNVQNPQIQLEVLDKLAEFCKIEENKDVKEFILESDSWRWLGSGSILRDKLAG